MGSLFDGIGGFPLAAVRNGIRPVWASEIEAFPIEVTKLRFPNMVHAGDITKLNGAELPPVNIICGGGPCQDLSVAGARAGLAGARSGLFMDTSRWSTRTTALMLAILALTGWHLPCLHGMALEETMFLLWSRIHPFTVSLAMPLTVSHRTAATAAVTLTKVAQMHAVAIIHAESEGILKVSEERVRASGRKDGIAYNETHPKEAEIEAIERAVYYLELTGAEGVILHVSTAEGLKLIHSAKERGVKVWAESAPHLFQFTVDDMKEKGPYLKFSPVMHDEENRRRMWELLGKGYVDYIGSDHSPYTLEEKQRGEEDIFLAPNGIPGVETSLAVFLNGVNAGCISLPQLVRMTSRNTARIYGLAPEKGDMTVGTDADFTIVDMNMEKVFRAEDLRSKCKWSPYIGLKLKGWPVMTIVRGNVICKDGVIVGKQGFGKYLRREK